MRARNPKTNLPQAIATTAPGVDPDEHLYKWGECVGELHQYLELLLFEVRAHDGHRLWSPYFYIWMIIHAYMHCCFEWHALCRCSHAGRKSVSWWYQNQCPWSTCLNMLDQKGHVRLRNTWCVLEMLITPLLLATRVACHCVKLQDHSSVYVSMRPSLVVSHFPLKFMHGNEVLTQPVCLL